MKHLMTSFKSFTKTQKIFTAFFFIGFLSNIVFDFHSYLRLDDSAKAGQEVAHTYEVLSSLRKLDENVDKYLLGEKQSLAIIHSEISDLKAQVKNAQVKELLEDLSVHIEGVKSVSLLAKMIQIESDLLKERTQKATIEDESYELMLIRILFADGILFGAMFLFFVLALRETKQSEWNLSESLKNIRDANSNLQAEIIRRQNKIKMTVHDLKNPLGTIAGFASLITDDEDKVSIHDYSEEIKKISGKSLQLVESILHSEEAPLEYTPTDMLKVLREVYTQNVIPAGAKNQTLVFDSQLKKAMVKGNAAKLEELFSNLLGNAIKYSPLGEKIWIRCFLQDGNYCVEVEDRGAGFTEDDKKHAFHFGEKLSAKPTGSESSTGIGLFIAKKCAELHNGKIKIMDTKTGVGACLHFEAPALEDKMDVSHLGWF